MKDKITGFLKATKIISRILFFIWLFEIIVGPGITSENCEIMFIGCTSFFLVPAIIIELNNHPMLNDKERKKPPLLHRILGTIFVISGTEVTLLAFAMIGDPNISHESVLIFGVLIFVFGVFMLRGFINRLVTKKRTRGVFLTEDQIEKLEKKVELPVVETPVFLNYGEVAVYRSIATRQFGNAKYSGDFVITTERVIFISPQKGFEINHQNITVATAYKDGLVFQCSKSNYTILLPRVDLATIAFDGVRNGDIPIDEIDMLNIDDDYDDINDDFDDVDEDVEEKYVLSRIDGMDGHKFEHFCANILEHNGFYDVSVTKGSGDQGVDILATKGGVKYAIQCKNYATVLGNTPIQEITAGKMYYSCHVGVVMTNSTFTSGARSLAQATGVLLWDREALKQMIENASVD